jgi:hypothetical protein
LHCYMAAAIRQEFSGVPGIRYLEKYKFCLGMEGFPAGLDGTVVCRFKRLNVVGQSRTYPTDRARQLASNNFEIDGIPEGSTILDIGYVLNELGTGFRDVQVIRVLGTEYVMSLPRVEDGTVQMPSNLFENGTPSGRRFEIIRPRDTGTGRL